MSSHRSVELRQLIWKLSWCRERALELGLDGDARLIRLAIDQIRKSAENMTYADMTYADLPPAQTSDTTIAD